MSKPSRVRRGPAAVAASPSCGEPILQDSGTSHPTSGPARWWRRKLSSSLRRSLPDRARSASMECRAPAYWRRAPASLDKKPLRTPVCTIVRGGNAAPANKESVVQVDPAGDVVCAGVAGAGAQPARPRAGARKLTAFRSSRSHASRHRIGHIAQGDIAIPAGAAALKDTVRGLEPEDST